jgi:hypothetical protein
MKTCSKCKKDQPRENFVKSARYHDGLYPSCKECRKKTLAKTLEDHPLCSKCKTQPHAKGHLWCLECNRDYDLENPRATYNVYPVADDGKPCLKCGLRPHAKGHRWCSPCHREYQRSWAKKRGGWWNCINKEQKRKAVIRRYTQTLLDSGRLTKQPCEVCGNPNTQGHHDTYEDDPAQRKVRWLCPDHHLPITKATKTKQLTFRFRNVITRKAAR